MLYGIIRENTYPSLVRNVQYGSPVYKQQKMYSKTEQNLSD